MAKYKILLLIGVVVIAVACTGTPTTAPTMTVKVAAPTAVTAPPTDTPSAPSPTAAAAPSGGLAVTPAGPAAPPKLDPAGLCKASSAPRPVTNFPVTLPTDQSRGSDKAQAVLYEYSDFQ